MAGSQIDWCDRVWEVTRGCSPIGAGCTSCWAARYGHRFSKPGLPYEGLVKDGKWTGRVKLLLEKVGEPLHWQKPQRIFVNSKSDLFHEDVPDSFIAAVFGIMSACPQHIFQILTKRPGRAQEWFGLLSDWCGKTIQEPSEYSFCLMRASLVTSPKETTLLIHASNRVSAEKRTWPLPNVWIGASAENQATANERIPELLKIPAAVHFVSLEPLLEGVRLKRRWLESGGAMARDGGQPSLSWAIVGAESGPKARPFDEAWARDIRDQCAETGTAYYYKQRPSANGRGVVHTPKLDGRCWTQFPVAHIPKG